MIQDAVGPIGIDILRKIKESVLIPVVGIGGIGISNLEEIKTSGIDGISLISAILGNNDIEGASRNLINSWRK